MTFKIKIEKYYPYFLVFTLILLLLVPWGYYDVNNYGYTFIYKKLMTVLLGLTAVLSMYLNKSFKGAVYPALLGVAAFLAAFYLDENFEKHFILQVVYLEIVRQIFMMPEEVKRVLKKINPYILYAMVLKGMLLTNGNYIHGGYFSSNLYSFLLLLICLPEIKAKRYYNLVLPAYFLVAAGSKSVYLGVLMLTFYFVFTIFNKFIPGDFFTRVMKRVNIFHSFVAAVLFAFSIAFVLEAGLLFPEVYNSLEKQQYSITIRNMKGRGLVPTSRSELRRAYEAKQKSLLTEHPVSPYKTTLVLRAIQYRAFFQNFWKVAVVGNFIYILERAYGFNPHNAVLDIFSRLGILFCLCLAFLYKKVFFRMNSPLLLAAILPSLCLQPYGFSLGHGIVFVGLVSFILESKEV